MASTNVNVGRVQGAGFFYSTYADDNVATTIDKGTVLSELTIFEKDMIVDAKGRLYEVISILGDTINVEYKSTMQGEKGDTGAQGEVGSITLNGEVVQNAILFAPTGAGSADDILISTGGEPSWKNNIKDVYFSRENNTTTTDVMVSIDSFGLNNYEVAGSNSGNANSYSCKFKYYINVLVSINSPIDYDLKFTIKDIKAKLETVYHVAEITVDSLYNSITGSFTYVGTCPISSDEYESSSSISPYTDYLSFGDIVGTIPAGSTSLSVSLTCNETCCTSTRVEDDVYRTFITPNGLHVTSSGLNTVTYTGEGGIQWIDTNSLVSDSIEKYTVNGLSTVKVGVNGAVIIDSNGKIECSELWVGGKQIT